MGFIDDFQRMSVDDLRVEVIGLLKQAYADGRITVETLERRLKDATGASDKEALLVLISDIPEPERNGTYKSKSDEDQPWLYNERVPRESQSFFAILGSANRTGRWQPAQTISCASILGHIKLDFREAEFPRDGIRINGGCIMGNIEITVPPGINVDLSGIPLLGSMDNKSGSGDSGAPSIAIKGIAILGSVEVKRKELKPKQKKEPRGGMWGRKSRKDRQKDKFYDYK